MQKDIRVIKSVSLLTSIISKADKLAKKEGRTFSRVTEEALKHYMNKKSRA